MIMLHSSANALLDVALQAKLSDFGKARSLVSLDDLKTRCTVGTSVYIPPINFRSILNYKRPLSKYCVMYNEKIVNMYISMLC